MLPHARAVLVCPRVFRASFLFGGEGGGCVLLARGGQGSWSSPAFYSMGGGSFGLQAGIQDAEIVMMILTDNGLRAVMDNQFRLGADASVALVTIGVGVEGATTTALNADIVAFAKTRGLFAGVSLQGSVMSSDSAGDEVYYGPRSCSLARRRSPGRPMQPHPDTALRRSTVSRRPRRRWRHMLQAGQGQCKRRVCRRLGNFGWNGGRVFAHLP
jgi:lipid-binding SYLF domain-containing protein